MAAGASLLNSRTAFGYAANSAVQLGLLGCGHRGTTVATSFAKNTSARIVALADLFPDKLQPAKDHFDQIAETLGYGKIDPALMFHGYKAYQEIAASPHVDAVQISTTPWFHVQHLDAAVTAGKHVYCEKPVGVDIAQTLQALEIAKRAQGRLSLDVGFQIRSAPPFVELVSRIQSGAIGKVATISTEYDAPRVDFPPMPGVSPDERRIREWLWDLTLSGDIIVEQNIHVIDMCNWILGSHPLRARAIGGRNVINHPGDVWDNYQVIFTYPDDVHVSFSSTQFCPGDWFQVSTRIFGSSGLAEAPYSGALRIVGENAWMWKGSDVAAGANQPKFAANGAFSDNLAHADSEKDRQFIESITSGNFHNQAATGVESARSAMLGRMAGRLGREVTWDEMMQHPETYEMKIDMAQFQ